LFGDEDVFSSVRATAAPLAGAPLGHMSTALEN
jgi:hypothetical protein